MDKRIIYILLICTSFVGHAVEIEGAPQVTFEHYVKKIFKGENGLCYKFRIENQSDSLFELPEITFSSPIDKIYSIYNVVDSNGSEIKELFNNGTNDYRLFVNDIQAGRNRNIGFCLKFDKSPIPDENDILLQSFIPWNIQITHSLSGSSENIVFQNTFIHGLDDWLNLERSWATPYDVHSRFKNFKVWTKN